jgi:hypothetical protein
MDVQRDEYNHTDDNDETQIRALLFEKKVRPREIQDPRHAIIDETE